MALSDELAFLDATSQADLVRRKEVKPSELVEAAIERIERLNPTINAVVTPMYDYARALAQDGPAEGPFIGVPFLLKDLLASFAGVRMASGSRFLRDFVPDHDSELVARLKRAGLIIAGKTNTPEFGVLPTTEPRLFGPSRNPWNPNRSPGGSSGGAAAAVASGLVPMAHANDGGGSIRVPASCCGVFGLKPTRGRNPLGPDYGDLVSGLVVEHAVTRSVRDSAALLDATSGPDLGDPYPAPPPARPFEKEVGAEPEPLRIAFTASGPRPVPTHPDCVEAVQSAANLCAELGHEVFEARAPIDTDAVEPAFLTIWSAACTSAVDELSRLKGRDPRAEDFEPLTWGLYQEGRRHSAAGYLLALQSLQKFSREMGRFFLDCDVWLTPTLNEPPAPLGTFDSSPGHSLSGIARAAVYIAYTPVCNITGQPAMSVPLYWNAEGLPIGTQFVGRFGDEATLFRLAAQLESARPWARRRPPISA